MRSSDLAVIGPGRFGLHLVVRAVGRGLRCVAIRGRRPLSRVQRALLPSGVLCDTWQEPAVWETPGLLVVAVPDRAVSEVAGTLAATLDLAGVTVLHCSGLLPAAALARCRAAGARVASWHPLQSFPPLEQGTVGWDGVACAVEGDPEAVEAGFRLARRLGLEPWRVRAEDKVLYHAAAAVAANLPQVLVAAARDLLDRCGLPPSAGQHHLQPLVETAVRAALMAPALDGLTGPIARGDCETVERHLGALPPALADVYRAVITLAEQLSRGGFQQSAGCGQLPVPSPPGEGSGGGAES